MEYASDSHNRSTLKLRLAEVCAMSETPTISFWQHFKLVWQRAFSEINWVRDMLIGGCLSITSLALQVWWVLISREDWHLHKWQWIGSAILPTIAVIALNIAIRLAAAPWKLYQVQAAEHAKAMQIANESIASMRRELSTFAPILEMAEEDPKVFLKPLNAEFVSLGFMVFEVLNDGQRVNPAQGITVQTIPCVPLVRFEYIDSLQANERKRVSPTIGDDILPSYNVLPELNKAWREAWDRGGASDAMTEEAEFPFEIKIRYHDFRPRQFETTVSLRYCPVDDDAARRSALGSSKRGEYTFLKVTGTKFRRLS